MLLAHNAPVQPCERRRKERETPAAYVGSFHKEAHHKGIEPPASSKHTHNHV